MWPDGGVSLRSRSLPPPQTVSVSDSPVHVSPLLHGDFVALYLELGSGLNSWFGRHVWASGRPDEGSSPASHVLRSCPSVFRVCD